MPTLLIAHVARRYAPMRGGTERYVHDLARAQAEDGHRVRVLTLDQDVIGTVDGRLPAREIRDGVEVVRIPGFGAQRFAGTWRIGRVVKELRAADTIHVHDIRFLFGTSLLIAVAARRPVFFHTHGLIFHTRWGLSLKAMAMRLVLGPLLWIARAEIVAGSRPDATRLMHYAPYLRQTHLLENAIDLRDYLALPRSPDPGVLLCVGRVTRSKGIDRLLRGLARVAGEWRLDVAGPDEGGETHRLATIAQSLGIADRVRFLGSLEDDEMQLALSRATAAVFPSRGEGFGLALLEAMAAGVPVVASQLDAHSSVLGAELTHRLADFDDAAKLSRALADVLNLDAVQRTRLEAIERRRASGFNIQRLWEQIRELYVMRGLVTSRHLPV